MNSHFFKILLVEDVAEDVALIQRALSKAGVCFEMKVIESESEFAEQIPIFKPHVILCDHSLPQFNSIEALKIKNQLDDKIPLIIVTGSVSEDFRYGANDYVLKGNLALLPESIFRVLRMNPVVN